MRRLTVLGLALALTLGLVLPAAAQLNFLPAPNQFSQPGPGGIVQWSNASASCVNTTNACNFWGATLGSSFFATSPLTNQTPAISTTMPLHLSMRGLMTTNTGVQQISKLSVGINYGGSTATIPLVNNVTLPPDLSNIPVNLDVWLNPIATASSPGNTQSMFMTARLSWGLPYVTAPGSVATEAVFNSAVIGTTPTQSPTTLNVLWQYGSASATNAVRFYQRMLTIGE